MGSRALVGMRRTSRWSLAAAGNAEPGADTAAEDIVEVPMCMSGEPHTAEVSEQGMPVKATHIAVGQGRTAMELGQPARLEASKGTNPARLASAPKEGRRRTAKVHSHSNTAAGVEVGIHKAKLAVVADTVANTDLAETGHSIVAAVALAIAARYMPVDHPRLDHTWPLLERACLASLPAFLLISL